MGTQDLDQVLHHMEEKAEDELSFLLSTGPEYFTTGQLLRLKGQWEIKNKYFHQCYRALLWIAAVSPGWLLLWLGFEALRLPLIAFLVFLFFPFSIFLFLGGLVLIRKVFKGKGHLDMVGEMIEHELNNRKQKIPRSRRR